MTHEVDASCAPGTLTVAVVIATYNRPDHVRECLNHLERQTRAPEMTVIVDSSPDDATARVVDEYPHVAYVRNPHGRGHTATSRRIGVDAVSHVDIVTFLDDDAYADEDWLEHLLRPYADAEVAGVGGRASNGVPDEENIGTDQVGLFLADGSLTGNFAAITATDVDVDHFLGANMSFRMSAITAAGGIEDFYPGTCLREESDLALRLRESGRRLVYTPKAHVFHIGGTYAKGRRFDMRYVYYAYRNHFVLLARVVGREDPRFRAYAATARQSAQGALAYSARSLGRRRLVGAESIAGGVGRGITNWLAIVAGTVTGRFLARSGRIRAARPAALCPGPSQGAKAARTPSPSDASP